MKIRKGWEESYEEHKKLNKDKYGYGQYIFEFANQWANLMESELDKITKLNCKVRFIKQNAEKLAKKTPNYNGLSGFQYECAINILVSYWKYGFELWSGFCLEEYY